MTQNQSVSISSQFEEFSFPNIPTMISEVEKQYLFFLGKKYWSGLGNIVEIGPWLGGSTYCLAAGFNENPNRNDYRIVVYDNFIWRPFMSERADLPLNNGDDFSGFFHNNIKKFDDFVSYSKASLPDERIKNDIDAESKRYLDQEEIPLIRYVDDKPVEILFIDGAKSWKGTLYMLENFHENFIPDKTLLVCQDYKYWGCYWIIIILEYLQEHLVIEHILPLNSVSFRLQGNIPGSTIERIPSFDEIGIEEGIDLIENAATRLKSYDGYSSYLIIKLNEIKFLTHKGEIDKAEFRLKALIKNHPIHLSRKVFFPVIYWFNDSYNKQFVCKETLLFRVIRRIKRLVNSVK